MRKNFTYIAWILDRSGSMGTVKSPTIEGFNKFLLEQRTLPGQCVMSLYQFDDIYEPVFSNIDIRLAPYLSHETYQPRGMTALLDAMGFTIDNVGNYLSTMPEHDRPDKVIVVTQTDGMENASKRYTKTWEIQQKVVHQQDKYSWQFVFLGANMDAIGTAQSFGIPMAAAATYTADSVHTSNLYKAVSYTIGAVRTGGSSVFNFTDDDRSSLLDPADPANGTVITSTTVAPTK